MQRMKFLLVVCASVGLWFPSASSLAAVSQQAASLAPAAPQVSPYDAPTITSVRGRIVKVQVPAGYDRITIERRTVVRPRPWVVVATQATDGTARELTFRLRGILPKRALRIVAHRMESLPEQVTGALSTFLADASGAVTEQSAEGGRLSIDSGGVAAGTLTLDSAIPTMT